MKCCLAFSMSECHIIKPTTDLMVSNAGWCWTPAAQNYPLYFKLSCFPNKLHKAHWLTQTFNTKPTKLVFILWRMGRRVRKVNIYQCDVSWDGQSLGEGLLSGNYFSQTILIFPPATSLMFQLPGEIAICRTFCHLVSKKALIERQALAWGFGHFGDGETITLF